MSSLFCCFWFSLSYLCLNVAALILWFQIRPRNRLLHPTTPSAPSWAWSWRCSWWAPSTSCVSVSSVRRWRTTARRSPTTSWFTGRRLCPSDTCRIRARCPARCQVGGVSWCHHLVHLIQWTRCWRFVSCQQVCPEGSLWLVLSASWAGAAGLRTTALTWLERRPAARPAPREPTSPRWDSTTRRSLHLDAL